MRRVGPLPSSYRITPLTDRIGPVAFVSGETEEPKTRAVDLCLEMVLDGGTERYSKYGLSGTYYWEQRIISISPVRRSIPLGGGLGTVGNCTIKLADADRDFREHSIDNYIGRRVNLYIADADTGSTYQILTGKIKEVDFDESSFSLRIKDDSYKKLQQFVSDRIVQDRSDWANLPSTLKAVLVPILQGVVSSSNYRKTGYLPAYLVDPAVGQTKYRYLACQGSATISKVFRNGVEIDSGDWTETHTNDPSGSFAVTYIDIDYDQREGSDLTKETITWDGTGPNGTATPAEAIEETLKLAGWDSDDYDAASFTAANALYDDAAKTITAGVGVIDKDEIIEDFLEDCGRQFSAYLFYNTAGKLEIIFESWEVPASDAYSYIIDDSIIQSISVNSVAESRTGLKTDYAYNHKERESSWNRTYSDSDELTRQNSVADIGRFEIPFVYDATSADSLIYCRLKAMSTERQIITIRTAAIAGLELGDYLKVISNFGSGASGYQALLVRVLGIETAVNREGGIDHILTCVDHEGDAFPSISSADTAGTDADVVEDSRDITTNIVFSSSAYNAISWTSGSIKMPSGQTFSINSGSSTGWGSAIRYIYFDPDTSTTALQVTTVYSEPAVRRGYLLATARAADDSSASSASFDVRYGLSDYSGSTFTGSIFQTSASNPKVRIDPSDYFQLISSNGYKIIQIDTSNYFTLRDSSNRKAVTITPNYGIETWSTSGNLNVRIGEPAGTYVFFVKRSISSQNPGFAFNQTDDTVEALWWHGITYAAKIYPSSADVLKIEASNGTGAIQIVANYLESGSVHLDSLQAKTNASDDQIDICDASGNVQSIINCITSNYDSGISTGTYGTTRGYIAVGAQTSGTDRAGVVIFQNETGNLFYLWVDTSGNLRGHTSDPGANDTAGVVIADLDP